MKHRGYKSHSSLGSLTTMLRRLHDLRGSSTEQRVQVTASIAGDTANPPPVPARCAQRARLRADGQDLLKP